MGDMVGGDGHAASVPAIALLSTSVERDSAVIAQLIQKHGDLESVMASLDRDKYKVTRRLEGEARPRCVEGRRLPLKTLLGRVKACWQQFFIVPFSLPSRDICRCQSRFRTRRLASSSCILKC